MVRTRLQRHIQRAAPRPIACCSQGCHLSVRTPRWGGGTGEPCGRGTLDVQRHEDRTDPRVRRGATVDEASRFDGTVHPRDVGVRLWVRSRAVGGVGSQDGAPA